MRETEHWRATVRRNCPCCGQPDPARTYNVCFDLAPGTAADVTDDDHRRIMQSALSAVRAAHPDERGTPDGEFTLVIAFIPPPGKCANCGKGV